MTEAFQFEVVGEGERVVLVHGSGPPKATWADQLPLAERYQVVTLERRGYGRSEGSPDFDADAEDVLDLLNEPAHLVGFSYGGLGVLLAAGQKPKAVRSLAVIEPAAYSIAAGSPDVDALRERLSSVYEVAPELGAEEFDARFDAALGFDHPPEPLDEETRRVVQATMRERPAWEAEIPATALREAAFPKLVVSGGWSRVFEAICDVLAETIRAQRAAFPEYAAHGVQHASGFNARIEELWRSGSPR